MRRRIWVERFDSSEDNIAEEDFVPDKKESNKGVVISTTFGVVIALLLLRLIL